MMMWLWYWLHSVFAAAALIYVLTLFVGMFGNCWVVASMLRTNKKGRMLIGCGTSGTSCSSNNVNSSDRLRKYIWLLALFDLLISCSLIFRLWNLMLPEQRISDSTCQLNFGIDQLLKLCSLTCLACISIERFIPIRKPFNNKVRKLAVQLTPLFGLLSIALFGGAILWLALNSVRATEDGLNCVQRDREEEPDELLSANLLANWIFSLGFCLELTVIGTNYGHIVHHVRRRFLQRKARAVANSFSCSSTTNTTTKSPQSTDINNYHHCNGTTKLLLTSSSNNNKKKASSAPAPQTVAAATATAPISQLVVVSEPRYMRQMTHAIVRIAVFHLVCWLPFCLLQLAPVIQTVFPFSNNFHLNALRIRSLSAIRIVDIAEHGVGSWIAFAASWLTYANSAGNWVLYAALNRDLRSIIKECSARRKRSTLSSHHQLHHHHQQQQHLTHHHHQQQQHSSSAAQNSRMLKRSIRRNALQTLRLFYSLNSHRCSSHTSLENENNSAATTILVAQNSGGKPTSSNDGCGGGHLRAPAAANEKCWHHHRQLSPQHKLSVASGTDNATEQTNATAWRIQRAHTFCTNNKTTTTTNVKSGVPSLSSAPPAPAIVSLVSTSAHLAHLHQQNIITAATTISNVKQTGSAMTAVAVAHHSNNKWQKQSRKNSSATERREMFAGHHHNVSRVLPPPIRIPSICTTQSIGHSFDE